MRKWLPCGAMMLVSLISYVDRNTLALLAPTILRDCRLTDEQYGWIISAFSVAYMVGNPLWGRLLDRAGVFVGMLAAVALWSAASASHALAAGLVGFAAARALLGFGEGATFPGGLRTATQTLPADRRARGIALAYSGGSLGAILTPIVVTPVALRFGWRAAFLLTGALGASWVVLWLRLGRAPSLRATTTPPSSTSTSAATVTATHAGARVRLGDRRLWAFMAAYALGALPLAFVLYAAPIYLHQARGQSQAALGRWLWLPPLGWEVGYFAWGWLADRLARGRDPRVAHGRIVAALVALGLALAAAPLWPSMATVMAALSFAMFVAAGFVIVAIAYATHVFGTREAGLIAGVGAGSWSAVVALVMPWFGRLFDTHRYGHAFVAAALIPVAGAALWRALR